MVRARRQDKPPSRDGDVTAGLGTGAHQGRCVTVSSVSLGCRGPPLKRRRWSHATPSHAPVSELLVPGRGVAVLLPRRHARIRSRRLCVAMGGASGEPTPPYSATSCTTTAHHSTCVPPPTPLAVLSPPTFQALVRSPRGRGPTVTQPSCVEASASGSGGKAWCVAAGEGDRASPNSTLHLVPVLYPTARRRAGRTAALCRHRGAPPRTGRYANDVYVVARAAHKRRTGATYAWELDRPLRNFLV